MLYGWMKSLIIYLIMSGLVVNLTPSKSYKRYISFFTGLLIVIILVRPLSFLWQLKASELDKITSGMQAYISEHDISCKEDMYDYYELGMNEAIRRSMEELGYKPKDISLITDSEGNILNITLTFNKDYMTDDTKIKKCLKEVYYVNEDSINIVKW